MQTGSEETSPVVAPGTNQQGCRVGMEVADTVVGTAGVDLGARWRAGRWVR